MSFGEEALSGFELNQEDAVAQHEAAVCDAFADMEFPHNLAKQALEATGGKSNLKATQWILDRRAEVQLQQQQLLAAESQDYCGGEQHGKNVGKGLGEEEIGSSFLPISPCGYSLHGEGANPKLVCMEGRGSSSMETPVSIGSSSSLDCPNEIVERQSLLKSVKLAARSKPSRSPEPAEPGKTARCKLDRLRAPLLDANYKRKWQDETDITRARPSAIAQSSPWPVAMRTGERMASLAERMQPTSIEEIVGQDHLLGPHCVLRSLLNDESLPSTIFWGPPGTGKTSLARLIARSASCRFTLLSSAIVGITEILEIVDEAKQARKFGKRTVLFAETLSRFNKSMQECVLPSIEAGYVVFIGATTENPSTEMISGLLLRCRVFTLKKLHRDHLCTVMKRAISDQEKGVLASLGDIAALAVEEEVFHFLADAADGDARVALNALESAVFIALAKAEGRMGIDVERNSRAAPEDQFFITEARTLVTENIGLAKKDAPFNVLEHLKGYFQFSQEEYARPFKRIVGGKEVMGTTTERGVEKFRSNVDMEGRGGRTGDAVIRNTTPGDVETRLLVTLSDAKEAIEWPDLALGKSQENIDSDLITALLKSIRGGDSNAAVYWLARILENSERCLMAANALLNFASEEVGLADPQALVQAVACYQACQFLGMKGCSSHLTQCAVYLSMAPKSAAVPQAFQSALKAVQNGQHDPVPSHLLSASGGLEESGYLPASLQNFKFLRWPEM